MVKFKELHVITDEGFSLYCQSFGIPEQDLDTVGSLLTPLKSFSKEALGEGFLSKVDFGEGADMILESGIRASAIAIVDLDEDNKEREENDLRNDLQKFIKKIEEIYVEELKDPIFRKRLFFGVGTLTLAHFFRHRMSRIDNQHFASLNEHLKYPSTLLFEITPEGTKNYSFYRELPEFNDLIGDISKEEFDKVI